jgi:hypothetical protein
LYHNHVGLNLKIRVRASGKPIDKYFIKVLLLGSLLLKQYWRGNSFKSKQVSSCASKNMALPKDKKKGMDQNVNYKINYEKMVYFLCTNLDVCIEGVKEDTTYINSLSFSFRYFSMAFNRIDDK